MNIFEFLTVSLFCVVFLIGLGAFAWKGVIWLVLRPDKNIVIIRPRGSRVYQIRKGGNDDVAS